MLFRVATAIRLASFLIPSTAAQGDDNLSSLFSSINIAGSAAAAAAPSSELAYFQSILSPEIKLGPTASAQLLSYISKVDSFVYNTKVTDFNTKSYTEFVEVQSQLVALSGLLVSAYTGIGTKSTVLTVDDLKDLASQLPAAPTESSGGAATTTTTDTDGGSTGSVTSMPSSQGGSSTGGSSSSSQGGAAPTGVLASGIVAAAGVFAAAVLL